MLVWLHPGCSVSKLVNRAKTESSRMVHETLDQPFRWQHGYGAFAVQPRALNRVIRYVRSQRRHHARSTTIEILERTTSPDDDANDDTPSNLAIPLP